MSWKKDKFHQRAVKLSLDSLTASKRAKIAALLDAYRAAVNFFIRSLWNELGGLDAATLARLKQTRLSERYKSQALKQAIEIVIATRQSAKELGVLASCPVFKGGAKLDAKFVTIEEGRGSFDLAVRLSTLHKGRRVTLLTRKTQPFLKWRDFLGARLVQGCELTENSIIVWFEFPVQEPKTEGDAIGVDVGLNKLLSDSDGNHYGTDFKPIRDKIRRRKPGSKGRAKACREREQYINKKVKELPFDRLAVIGVEELKNIKHGKRRGRGKSFRKAIAPWTYRHVLNRIEAHAQENRVLLVRVDPANTSRTCPMCGRAHKESRKGEIFRCIYCGHTADADTVGALEILARTSRTPGSVESPVPF